MVAWLWCIFNFSGCLCFILEQFFMSISLSVLSTEICFSTVSWALLVSYAGLFLSWKTVFLSWWIKNWFTHSLWSCVNRSLHELFSICKTMFLTGMDMIIGFCDKSSCLSFSFMTFGSYQGWVLKWKVLSLYIRNQDPIKDFIIAYGYGLNTSFQTSTGLSYWDCCNIFLYLSWVIHFFVQKAYKGALWSNRKLWTRQFHNFRYSGKLMSLCLLQLLKFKTFLYTFHFSIFISFQDKESVGNLVKLIDKSNGYIFAGIEASAVEFSKIAVGSADWDYYRYPCVTLFLVMHCSWMASCHIFI